MTQDVLVPGQYATIDADAASDGVIRIAPEGLMGVRLNSPADDQKGYRLLVQRRHPHYDESSKHWEFLEETYEGGREWFKKNIFRYMKEGDQEYRDRVQRAYRFNHTREVVDLINKYLFKQNIVRNDVDSPQCVQEFWKSSTRSGLSIDDFAKQVSKKTSIYGRVGIVVDTTAPSGQILSKADAKKKGVKTYAYIVTPNQLLDYAFDDNNGDLLWVLIREVVRDDTNPLKSSGKQHERFRLWTQTDWQLYEEQTEGRRKIIKKIASGDHNLGVVPVILADNIVTDEEYESPALIDDIAYLDRAVANYLSNMDAIIQDQTFSQLVMPAQNVIPGEDNYTKMQEMGTKRVFLYDGEGGKGPEYISPDVKQAELIMGTINKVISEIYHTVGLAGERTKQDNAVGIDNSSGVAKAYDFERVNALLAAKAASMETIERKITALVALWNSADGQMADNDFVSYPKQFDTRGLYDEFDIAARLMLIDAPDSVRQEQMEMMIDKLFPQLDKETKSKMLKDVEDWPVDPLQEQAQLLQRGVGKPVTSKVVVTDPTTAAPNTPNAPGDKKQPTKNKRQGQVTKNTN